MPNWQTIREISTAAVAVYAALLSTVTLVSQRRDKRRTVAVKTFYGKRITGSGPSDDMVFLEASNPGSRPVMLTSAGFSLGKMGQILLPPREGFPTFPHQLNEGASCNLFVELRHIKRDLDRDGHSGKVKLTGFYRDALGKIYTARPTRIDVGSPKKGAQQPPSR